MYQLRRMIDTARPNIRVIRAGPLSLVQDRGRVGYQRLGVSVSGAADIDALDIGNLLVGNGPKAASLEVTLGGLVIEFSKPTVFALTGADTNATLDEVPVGVNISYFAHPYSRLELGMASQGLRSYVAIAGGIEVSETLGSRSTHLASAIGGIDGRALADGDVLDLGEPEQDPVSGRLFPIEKENLASDPLSIRVILGPQDDEFTTRGIDTLLGSEYTVSDQSNRQGLRLDGPTIESKTGSYDIVSDAVVNGSIQVPGDGKPIILLADRQTTGGYAKIATVATVDQPKLGQAPPGATIMFKLISVEESQKLLSTHRRRFEEVELVRIVEPISLHVDGARVDLGVAENNGMRLAEVEGVNYPILVEEYTPAD